jgi:hypothetical protein
VQGGIKMTAFKQHAGIRVTPSLERQQWLELAVEALREKFASAGYSVPEKIRVSIGWPKRAASCGAIGECWSVKASSDRHAELFISPQLTDGARIVDVLAHELVHATVGTDAGHGKLFKQCALKIGLVGPMRATTAGAEFVGWAEALFKRIGPYPAGFLTDTPKQGTRLIKCECANCGYNVRITRKWLTLAGPPICPTDKVSLVVNQSVPETAAAAALEAGAGEHRGVASREDAFASRQAADGHGSLYRPPPTALCAPVGQQPWDTSNSQP